MLALASIATTVAAGYHGAPWWAAVICSMTLFLRVVAFHGGARLGTNGRHAEQLVFVAWPICLLSGFAAIGAGHLASGMLALL